jgi:hypothetical protein
LPPYGSATDQDLIFRIRVDFSFLDQLNDYLRL